MKTLIKLYGERPYENVIGPELFRPEQVVYLGAPGTPEDMARRESLKSFFRHRGLQPELYFVPASLYDAGDILRQLIRVADKYPDCAIDITGGTDAALFAAGQFCSSHDVPAFTYSRHRNRYFMIFGETPEPSKKATAPIDFSYRVEDFFRMTGGSLRKGRVDNAILETYLPRFDDFFALFLRHRRTWSDFVIYMQRVSRSDTESLQVNANFTVKGEHGSRVSANVELLRDLAEHGFLKDLEITDGESVSFTFPDSQWRSWLRDVGSVLELYMYKVCQDTGLFSEVISSAVVDWDGTVGRDSVSNEIDVAAASGIIPLFISCKACEIKTEALNELAILADRFGGKGAKAVIVTTERCSAAARHRAAKLGIAVIDLEELEAGSTVPRIRTIMGTRTASAI